MNVKDYAIFSADWNVRELPDGLLVGTPPHYLNEGEPQYLTVSVLVRMYDTRELDILANCLMTRRVPNVTALEIVERDGYRSYAWTDGVDQIETDFHLIKGRVLEVSYAVSRGENGQPVADIQELRSGVAIVE